MTDSQKFPTNMSQKDSIRKFYDTYVQRQTQTGINLRHRTILKWLKQYGMKPQHRVLEIGCGIGTASELVAAYLRGGELMGVDISEKSIEAARERLARYPHATFEASDMSDFQADDPFDVIFLPDVLEHIPISEHAQLFQTMRQVLKPDGMVLIHIPNPRFLRWMHEAHPEKLQVIDQPIDTDGLLSVAYPADFYLDTLTTYSLFYDQPDYQLIVFRPNSPVVGPSPLNKYVTGLKKLWLKIF